jgi:hypothetical protein
MLFGILNNAMVAGQKATEEIAIADASIATSPIAEDDKAELLRFADDPIAKEAMQNLRMEGYDFHDGTFGVYVLVADGDRVRNERDPHTFVQLILTEIGAIKLVSGAAYVTDIRQKEETVSLRKVERALGNLLNPEKAPTKLAYAVAKLTLARAKKVYGTRVPKQIFDGIESAADCNFACLY